jgi:nitroimidazol reductase NimA-like FMN-containing flavoprotein (pyridoxamine 5'-phosphate oxidase superfamily)
MKRRAEFQRLTPRECRDVLARNHVGRLAFLHGRGVDIEPLGYGTRGNWLFLRSAFGTKFVALAHSPYVAFEVDEVRGPLDWRSVVIHGTMQVLPPDGAPLERLSRAKAVAAFRSVLPDTLGPNDPTPERQIVYGVHVVEIEGRMARSAPPAPHINRARARGIPKRRGLTRSTRKARIT